MLPALFVFVLVVGIIMGGYTAMMRVPGMLAARRLDRRLLDISMPAATTDTPSTDETVVKHTRKGPLPELDRLLAQSGMGSRLARLIDQSGVPTTPSAVVIMSLVAGTVAALLVSLFVHQPFAAPLAGLVVAAAPFGFLKHRRSARQKRFEEQFPEALDLLARAIRAGHAFQTALGMVADELSDPVGPEFKKTFDQQNYGLPLRDALNEMAARVAILDVRFFVTAVLIQRDTGGNLSEILDNLAHVVRERFKIKRQVRVHTAHGRFTGYVLLALPAALAVALTFINPEHMNLLFRERMGQTMLTGALVMQTVGFFWIRHVIKIEV
ncbi:MAG TPA: type II secretion system F family protein [Vicinamibacterales bacterium]|nr:type II secretion system F family protein [Vicinamibacterales bacterium]